MIPGRGDDKERLNMKKIRFLFLLSIIALLGAGCASNPADLSSVKWKTEHIINTEYGFEYNLQYPEKWKIDQADDRSVVIATEAGVNESDSSFTATTLATGPQAKDAVALAAFTKKTLERKYPASTVIEKTINLAGRNWQVLELKNVLVSARGAGEKKNPNADLVPGNAIYYFSDNAPYVARVAFAMSAKEQSKLLPIYQEMLKRFDIIPAVGPKQ